MSLCIGEKSIDLGRNSVTTFLEKIGRLRQSIYSQLCLLVLDGDFTLFDDNHWQYFNDALPENLKNLLFSERQPYFAKYATHTMDKKDEIRFVEMPINNYFSGNLDKSDINRIAKTIPINFWLLKLLKKVGPNRSALISYGIKDLLEEVIKYLGIIGTLSYATKLAFDKNNYISGIDGKIIIGSEKHECLCDFVQTKTNWEDVIVVGDSKFDHSMMLESSFNILIDHQKIYKYDNTIPNVDCIVPKENLPMLVNLILGEKN